MVVLRKMLLKYATSIGFYTFLLFLIVTPLISKVNFIQGDEWNRTTTVARFMTGDFTLLPETATTFYTQGLIGTVAALLFGLKKLPYLTLLFSVLNFYIFCKIVNKHLDLNKLKSVVLGLILFFTPLHMYSTIGFMTENYVLFFLLLSVYIFLNYSKNHRYRDFALFNLSGALAFYGKQNGIIFNLAVVLQSLYKRNYKQALIQASIALTILVCYVLFFPKTEVMKAKGIFIENLMDLNYVYTLLYGMALVSVSYTLPIVIYFIIKTLLSLKNNSYKIVKVIIIAVLCFVCLNKFFDTQKFSYSNYPYFENTFQRNGFHPKNIDGNKYTFVGSMLVFDCWELISKASISLLIPCLFFYKKRIINIYSITIVGYFVLMLLVKVFYDRYLLPIVPLTLLLLLYLSSTVVVEKIYDKYLFLIQIIFVVFIGFLSVQMAIDFINVNSYVWGKSEALVQEGVPPERIVSSGAWARLYGTGSAHEYYFSYDSPSTEPKHLEQHYLYEEKDLYFLGNIFIRPKVYLYKSK